MLQIRKSPFSGSMLNFAAVQDFAKHCVLGKLVIPRLNFWTQWPSNRKCQCSNSKKHYTHMYKLEIYIIFTQNLHRQSGMILVIEEWLRKSFKNMNNT